MFETILRFCHSLYQVMVNTSSKLINFFCGSLNELTGLGLDLPIMNMSLISVLLGGGLIAFLTYKLIKFLVNLL